jgi:hypothetical protein
MYFLKVYYYQFTYIKMHIESACRIHSYQITLLTSFILSATFFWIIYSELQQV